MLFFIAKTPTDRMYSTQCWIANIRHRRARLILPLPQPIDDDSFAQSPVACAYRPKTESVHHALEYLSTGNDDVSPLSTKLCCFATIRWRHLCENIIQLRQVFEIDD